MVIIRSIATIITLMIQRNTTIIVVTIGLSFFSDARIKCPY